MLLAVLPGARLVAAAPSVGIVVTGDPALQAKVRRQVSGWMQQHGFTVAAGALSPVALKTLTDCFVVEDMTCARGVVEHQATSPLVVFVRVELLGGKRSKEANLVAYWFMKDREAAVDKRKCKPCTGKVLAKVSTELMTSVYEQSGLRKARLEIEEPPKLIVMLDEVNVGVTPLEQDVAPGSHTIALVRDDVTLGTTTIDVKAGEVTTVRVPISSPDPVASITTREVTREPLSSRPSRMSRASRARLEPPAPPQAHEAPSLLVPGLVIVAGLGVIATGGTLLYYGHKGGPGEPLIYPDATKQGALVAGAGGAVVITGLLLWWRASDSADRQPTNGPTATVGRAGTMVGWVGQF